MQQTVGSLCATTPPKIKEEGRPLAPPPKIKEEGRPLAPSVLAPTPTPDSAAPQSLLATAATRRMSAPRSRRARLVRQAQRILETYSRSSPVELLEYCACVVSSDEAGQPHWAELMGRVSAVVLANSACTLEIDWIEARIDREERAHDELARTLGLPIMAAVRRECDALDD